MAVLIDDKEVHAEHGALIKSNTRTEAVSRSGAGYFFVIIIWNTNNSQLIIIEEHNILIVRRSNKDHNTYGRSFKYGLRV
jgi:hypothetical protein